MKFLGSESLLVGWFIMMMVGVVDNCVVGGGHTDWSGKKKS